MAPRLGPALTAARLPEELRPLRSCGKATQPSPAQRRSLSLPARPRAGPRCCTYQDNHVPELLQQTQLPAAHFELLVFWDQHFEELGRLAQRCQVALHGGDVLLLLVGDKEKVSAWD